MKNQKSSIIHGQAISKLIKNVADVKYYALHFNLIPSGKMITRCRAKASAGTCLISRYSFSEVYSNNLLISLSNLKIWTHTIVLEQRLISFQSLILNWAKKYKS